MTSEDESSITGTIRQVVDEHGHLSVPMAEVTDNDDLYEAGMTSHASVSVLFALEEAFDVEFLEEMLRKSTFESISAIEAALDILLEDKKVS
jgi:acyl carrier protein